MPGPRRRSRVGPRPSRLSDTLAEGRRAARERMRGICKIERPGERIPDGRGGETVEMTPVYEGPYYSRYPGLAFETNLDSVGVAVAQSRVVVRIHFGPTFRPGDVVTILSSRDTPHLAGTVLRVASIDDQDQGTAQRLLCEDNQSGMPAEEG